MSWAELQRRPRYKKARHPVSASVNVYRGGSLTLRLSVRLDQLPKGWGLATRVDAQLGQDDDAGKVRLSRAPKGRFVFARTPAANYLRLAVALPNDCPWPDGALPGEASIEPAGRNAEAVIVILPTWLAAETEGDA